MNLMYVYVGMILFFALLMFRKEDYIYIGIGIGFLVLIAVVGSLVVYWIRMLTI